MDARAFAGINARPSPWGYNWTTENVSSTDYRTPNTAAENSARNSPMSTTSASSPEPQMMTNQYANMPAALLTSLKRDKKPFTYTPGGVNLNEVLNARLQKRIERKKKYSEEKMANPSNVVDNLPKFEGQKQLIVMPTYNSPLEMYSMENALEALEVQAELAAHDKALSSGSRSATLPRNYRYEDVDADPRGVSQSKAFKVLQIITDTDEDPALNGKDSHHHEEMRFKGIRDSKTIPSRFFQTLQKVTGTDEEEEEAPREIRRVAEPPKTGVFQQTQPIQNLNVHQGQTFYPSSSAAAPQAPAQMIPSASGLKRPAAFLPANPGFDPLSRVKSVKPAFLMNGPRQGYNPGGMSDF